MLRDEIAAYLATVTPSLGLIKVGPLPATPDVCIAVGGYGGAPPTHGFGISGLQYEEPGVQLLVRGAPHDSVEPEARAQRAYQAMAKIQGMTLSGTKYLMVRPQQSPMELKRDDQDTRVVFDVNFLCEKEPSAA